MTSLINWQRAQKRLPAGYTHCTYVASRIGFALSAFAALLISLAIGFGSWH